MRPETGGRRLDRTCALLGTVGVAVALLAGVAAAGPSASPRPAPRPSHVAPRSPAPSAVPSAQSSLQPPASSSPLASAIELPPEPTPSAAPVEPPAGAVPTAPPDLPPSVMEARPSAPGADPAEVAPAMAHGQQTGMFSVGGLVLLLLLAGCGAGVIWLGARVKELDERYRRLKETMARLDDGQEALQKRLTGADPRLARQSTGAGGSAGGGGTAPAADVSGAVDKAVTGAMQEHRARLEQVDRRADRLAKDLSEALAPALDEVKRKLDTLERRVADGQRNPFSTAGGARPHEPAAAPSGDPVSALAAGLARAQARLAPRAAGAPAPDPVAARMAEAIGGLEQGLAGVEQAAGATGGPLERDVADLAHRLRDFVRSVRSRAGQAADGAAPMGLDEFVITYADRIPEEARKRPTALLDLYFDTVSRGGAAKGGGPALSESDALQQVFTYVDTLHGLRSKDSEWDQRSGGGEAVTMALDRLFEDFRGFLRAYQISIVAPEPGQMPDPSACRVTSSVPRPNAQSNTVVRVIGCGFKNAMTGQVLRMAEVITAS